MTRVSSYDYLNAQVAERFSGDERRVAELFKTRDVFEQLVLLGRDSDWYHFTKKTFDGWYLVEHENGYAAYYQERGSVHDKRTFGTLSEAAEYFFKASGYVRS